MADHDERALLDLQRLRVEDGPLDSLNRLVREAEDAEGPVERGLTIRAATIEAASILRTLRRADQRCRDAASVERLRTAGVLPDG